jgi:hypothetical protein
LIACFEGFQAHPSAKSLPSRKPPMYTRCQSGPRAMRGGVVMDAGVVVASAWRRNVLRFLVAALLAAVSLGMRTVSAAECDPRDPHCDRRVHPSQYSDPRCESRRTGPNLQRDELRCDLREPKRKVVHPAPSVSPHSPPPPPPGQVPVTGASDPTRQQSRTVDRDVGFDDAFPTQANPGAAAGVGVHDPARRTPPGRSR